MVTRPSTARVPLVRRCLIGAAAVALAGGLVSYSAAVRAAAPPTVSEVTAQVSQLTTRENRAIQLYDQVDQQLATAKAALRQVDAAEARDQAQFNAMRTDIAQVAAAAYENGNMTSMATLLTSSSPQTVLSQAAMLVQLSSARYAEMRQFIAAARQLSGAQQQARRTEAAIAVLVAQRRAQADTIGRSLSEKKSLLATLTAQQQHQVESQATVGSGGTQQASDPLPASGSQGNEAVAFAYRQLGCPYVWGGTGPCDLGYDCSGLAQAAWAAAGVSIPRDTYEQWAALPHIPLADLEPGDLIYFNGESHVGIYVGGGDIIDAPEPGENVEKVSLSEPWYAGTEDGAARP